MAEKCCADVVSKMKRRVTIQNVSMVSDDQGGFTETWTDGATIWAGVEPASGYEKFQAMQMQTPITHKILTRYRSDLTTSSRLKLGSRILWVQEALNVGEESRFLSIKATERAV